MLVILIFFIGVNPQIFISPDVGYKIPVSIFIVVDLPAPFGPINATVSPPFTLKDILLAGFTYLFKYNISKAKTHFSFSKYYFLLMVNLHFV